MNLIGESSFGKQIEEREKENTKEEIFGSSTLKSTAKVLPKYLSSFYEDEAAKLGTRVYRMLIFIIQRSFFMLDFVES